jgi:hypothetical protein
VVQPTWRGVAPGARAADGRADHAARVTGAVGRARPWPAAAGPARAGPEDVAFGAAKRITTAFCTERPAARAERLNAAELHGRGAELDPGRRRRAC